MSVAQCPTSMPCVFLNEIDSLLWRIMFNVSARLMANECKIKLKRFLFLPPFRFLFCQLLICRDKTRCVITESKTFKKALRTADI